MDATNDTPENALEARAELQPVQTPAGDQPPVSRTHTYPDGCVVVGVPPFPEQSPLERQAKALREESADLIVRQQSVANEAAAKVLREEEAARIAAKAAAASTLPAGIVTADDVQQSPGALTDTPAA